MSSKQSSPNWEVIRYEDALSSAPSAAPSPSAALFYAPEAQLHVASTASSARQRSVSGSGVSHFNVPPISRGRSNSATDILRHALTRMRLIALQEELRVKDSPVHPAALLESVSTVASVNPAERPSTPSRPSSVNSSRSTP